MAEEVQSSSTITMVVTSKEAGSKRTVLDDLYLTFRSPMGWMLVVALLITWASVAVVLFDLLDYKTLTDYTSYCDDPCLPPGLAPPPAAVRKALKEAGRSKGGVQQVISDPVVVVSDTTEDSPDWLNLLVTFVSSLVAPEEEEIEGVHNEEL
ncbi:triadin-like isoform X2 [Hypomesus transpacificus]|uniref:triadin-like isoform X2 n=1 Tax=Hypomesus transpacificus TaxID=137520 RepID=UPI001F084CED|nr:triadin-like isoform X2 [Hypomesus transpacificus]